MFSYLRLWGLQLPDFRNIGMQPTTKPKPLPVLTVWLDVVTMGGVPVTSVVSHPFGVLETNPHQSWERRRTTSY